MPNRITERAVVVLRFESVRGLDVRVWQTLAEPRTISVVILGPGDGCSIVAQIDRSDRGARARAISLATVIHDTLQSAESSWFSEARDA